MSWAAHNPELWDMVCKRGLHWRIADELKRYGYDFDKEHGHDEIQRDMLMEAIIDVLYDQSELSSPLACWAHKEVSEAQGDYFSSMADAAVDRAKYE